MVHALEKIWRILKPGGVLIDIHPFSQGHFIEAYREGKRLFSERVRKNESQYVLHAEKAISAVTDNGLFAVDKAAEFDFFIYALAVPELSDYWKSLDAFDDQPDPFIVERERVLFAQVAEILETSGEGAQTAIRERIRMTSLRTVPK